MDPLGRRLAGSRHRARQRVERDEPIPNILGSLGVRRATRATVVVDHIVVVFRWCIAGAAVDRVVQSVRVMIAARASESGSARARWGGPVPRDGRAAPRSCLATVPWNN